MDKQYILVVGAGSGQVPLMNWSHDHGYAVIAVSPQGDYPGLKIADFVVEEDIRFPDEIIKHLANVGKNIACVVSDQLDEAMPTVARLSELLNLHGNGYDVALKFQDKYIMRKEAEQLGCVAVPRCVRVSECEVIPQAIVGLKFPMMIKPLDRASSRGVYMAKDMSELIAEFPKSRKYSMKGVIIEEFIKGREWVVEGFTVNGRTQNLIVGHREYFDVPGTFIPCATVFQDADSANSEVEKRLKRINKKLVEGFGLNFGLTHAEYIYNEDDDMIYLVEIAARGGGVCISSDLIPAACGVDSRELYMQAALGNETTDISLSHGAAAYFCFMLPEGRVISIEGLNEIHAVPGFLRAELDNVKIGMDVSAARDKYSRKGPILVKGATKADCYKVIEEIKRYFKVFVQTANGVSESYWK